MDFKRRGQKKFRNALRKQYGDKCMVTGCEILDIVEAAHINPYRGEKDHHVANGLLLRADIHTLFDLDLLGINPDNLKIHLSKSINRKGYEKFEGCILQISGKKGPSKSALEVRWGMFAKSNKS
jgi:putative restriction endonuclease